MNVAVVGATGAVGREMLSLLGSRRFPVRELRVFASPRSRGLAIPFAGRTPECQVLAPGCFEGVQIAFFDASDAVSKDWALEAARAGAWVVDNSATYRMDPDVPLAVPEVNGALLDDLRVRSGGNPMRLGEKARIIAGPNCSTCQLVLPLEAIRARFGLRRVVVSSYQSVSGAGTAAMAELAEQTLADLSGEDWKGIGRAETTCPPKAIAHRIAFNCIPQIGGFKDGGYTSEERKIMDEARKILALPNLRITATAVRVPAFRSHAESVNVECERAFSVGDLREALGRFPGIEVQDEPERSVYPMGNSEDSRVPRASGRDKVCVGRIRADESAPNAANLWIVADNLRKGAALNAIQIGERLIRG